MVIFDLRFINFELIFSRIIPRTFAQKFLKE